MKPKTKKSEAATATRNPLERFTTGQLAMEIYRRQRAGECLALIVTPDDICEYFECDESGATNPGSRVPSRREMYSIIRAFERWQDNGSYSDMMEAVGSAWREVQASDLEQEGGAK